MATPVMTLDEFRATRIEVPNLAETQWGWMDEEGPGYVYADGSAYINIDMNDREPYLVIGNLQWGKPLAELEAILYTEHYLPEVQGVPVNIAREAIENAKANDANIPESDQDAAAEMIEQGVFGNSEDCVDDHGNPELRFVLAVRYAREKSNV